MSSDLSAALAEAVSGHLGRAVSVSGLRRLAGGSSHETWAFDATPVAIDEGHPIFGGPRPLILRREFSAGMLDTDIGAEFILLRTLFDAGVPVPEPWFHRSDETALGRPFLVMERVAGTDLRKDLARRDCDRNRAALAQQAVAILAGIHAAPIDALGLPQPGGAGSEIDTWVAVLETTKFDLHPLLATAITWLRCNLPPAVPPLLVHADFKANNLLVSPEGELTVLDWELAHLGDPVEDLAWTMLWRTQWDVVGGLCTPDDFVANYAYLTGRQVRPAVLRFWRVFSLVKLWAMFLQGMATPSPRPQLRLLGRSTVWIQDQIASELLENA